ncbi:type I-E CRISPR-associated protein Cas5/CasD [Fontivita pretiosa]|uniref:type I-E CRISPR-associated protein Cas5/CasD n=1 Tax=Fontivita pretiosa TaxID=2989684 RepID=UPI003D17DFE8
MGQPNTLFLRLEGPLQSWGDPSKFVIRRSMDAPTKSGVLGLLCCAMGLSRPAARQKLPELNKLVMGVRIDRPGVRWWDYHTVGAGIGMTTAAGNVKTGAQGTLITRREYLADASFLVVLQGEPTIIEKLAAALRSPTWPLYLGRRSCPPSVPVFTQPRKDRNEPWANPMALAGDLKAALQAVPWYPRYDDDRRPDSLDCIIEWRATAAKPVARPEAEVWYDAPFSFDPPVHHPRLVMRDSITVDVGEALQQRTPPPPRPRADYKNREYEAARTQRLESDHGLCVFCKTPATTVQHVTYRRAGGDETQDDLRSLCRLCHDAVTMIEYGLGMGLDRINPEDPQWRDRIVTKRQEIIQFRSLETRRRRLEAQEVE